MTIAVVQSITGSATNTTGILPLTLPGNTTAGNCLVVFAGNVTSVASIASPTSCTLGGSAGNFAVSIAATPETLDSKGAAFVWLDPNCAGGQTAISANSFGSAGTYWNVGSAYEVSGLALTSPVDRANNSGAATSNSWASGTTPATTLASEIWLGSAIVAASAATLTGPSSPWNNIATVSIASHAAFMSGWQIVSSTGTANYTGTLSLSETWGSAVFTLKSAPAALPAANRIILQAVMRAANY